MRKGRKLVYTATVDVRWGDMDAYRHVNNTTYFRYLEQARVEWLESMGYPVSTAVDTGPVIINASCTFLAPVVYPSRLRVDVYAGDPGRSSVMTWYEIIVEGQHEPSAEGASKVVWMDHRTGRSIPLPGDLRMLVESP